MLLICVCFLHLFRFLLSFSRSHLDAFSFRFVLFFFFQLACEWKWRTQKLNGFSFLWLKVFLVWNSCGIHKRDNIFVLLQIFFSVSHWNSLSLWINKQWDPMELIYCAHWDASCRRRCRRHSNGSNCIQNHIYQIETI